MNVGVLSLVVEPPAGPPVIVVSGAAVSTVNVRDAGVGSVPFGPLTARTSNVCEPSVSAAVVNGVVQAANAAASTRHSNVTPPSFELNVNVGVLSLVDEPPAGPLSIVVSGGLAPPTTTNVREAGVGS